MRKHSFVIFPLLMLLIAGCGAGKEKRERIARERESWESSLSDSITASRAMQDSVKARLDELQTSTNELLSRFRCVDNPREVEKYYLPDVKGATYPLTRTGLTARLTASETLELIAVNTSRPFDQIEVRRGGESAASAVVPHDQALNYRNGTMTTVAFSGTAADSVAALVASMPEREVTLLFIQGGATVATVPLSAIDRECVSLAWRLADARREVLLSEKRLTQLARRIAIIESKRAELNAD
ncbi:MAG: hypothetical protein HDS26_04655 [Bacteroides sp.]|nr:hypothetical protein [Bacteroides sp.]